MKPQWTTYHNKFAEMIELYEQLRNGSTDKRMAKAFKKFTDFLNGVIGSHQEFGKLVEPVPPIDVKMPFDSERFAKEWKFWLDYLEEQHQKYWTSRVQAINLNFMAKCVQNDEKKAIAFIHAHVRCVYSKFFPLSDNQINGSDSNMPEEKGSTGFDPTAASKRI